MGAKKVLILCGIAALIVAVSSCTTTRANLLLLKETTPEEKAELLFKDGLERYQTVILQEQDLSAIPSVRTRFNDALKLDPEHAGAKKYLADLDAFRTKQFSLNLATANDLSKKENRSVDQDYDYVVAVKKLKQLDSAAPETKIFTKSTADIRTAVIKTRSEELSAMQKEIDAETDRAVKLKKLNNARRVANNILFIDPINPSVNLARDGIEKKIEDLTQTQNAAETQNAAVAQTPAKTAAATAAKTPVKASVKKAAPAHDYDADIQEILGSIDVQIKAGKPAEAMNLVRTNQSRLQVKANLDKLAAKKADVQKLAGSIYQNGISAYNDEDYETARAAFLKVVQYDAGYEQAQAYLDRSETKLRALSGS